MLSPVLSYLIGLLGSLSYIDTVKGLVVTKKKDGQKFTGVFDGTELVQINFDLFGSLAFFIQTEKIKRETNDHPFIGSKKQIKLTIPLSVILYKQGAENVNCESESQQIADGIAKNLTGVHQQLITNLSLDLAEIHTNDIDYDKDSIYESLFSGDSVLKDNDILVKIDFEVILDGLDSCFANEPCSPTSYVWDFPTTLFCDAVRACVGSVESFSEDGEGNTTFVISELAGKELLEVSTDGVQRSSPIDYSFDSVTGEITFTSAVDGLIQGLYK